MTERPQPGACLHCHASMIPTYRRLGGGDVFKGFEALGKMSYADAHAEVVKTGSSNPVAGGHERSSSSTRTARIPSPASIATIRRRWRCASRAPASSAAFKRSPTSDEPVPHLPSIERWRGKPRAAVRSQRRCHPAGDAVVRLRPVPRRILLRAEGDALLPLGQGPEGRADRELLRRLQVPRRPPLLRLEARRDRAPRFSRPSIPNSRCGARASTRAPASPAPTATCPTSAKAR